MDLVSVKQQIINRKLTNNVFLFCGEDAGVLKEYIRRLYDIAQGEYVFTDDYSTAYTALHTVSFFAEKQFVVLYNCDTMNCAMLDKLCKFTGDSVLVVVYVPGVTSILKDKSSDFLNFKKVQTIYLVKHIKPVLPLSEQTLEDFCSACFNNYGLMQLEADKVLAYKQVCDGAGDPISVKDSYNKLVSAGVVPSVVNDNVFTLLSAIMYNDFVQALKLLNDYLKLNDTCLGLLSMVYNTFRNMLLVCGCRPNDPIETQTGLSRGQIYMCKRYLDYYTVPQILSTLKYIQDLCDGVKNGKYEDKKTIEYLLVKLGGDLCQN